MSRREELPYQLAQADRALILARLWKRDDNLDIPDFLRREPRPSST